MSKRKKANIRRERQARRSKEREAVSTGQTPSESMNRHHRLTKKLRGSNHPDNISIVPISQHRAFNILFSDGHMPPPQIAEKFSKVWLRPDWEVVARRKGQQCVTPCGKGEPSCETSSPSCSAAVAKSASSESGFSPSPNSPTQLTQEKLIRLLELALLALNSKAN